MNSSEKMGNAPIGRLLLEFSLPATASMLVSALYSLADRVFIGRGTGVDGIAAATAAFPFMILGMAVAMLFTAGARAVASIALGRGEADKARETVSRATGSAFLATAVLSVVVGIFARPLLTAVGAGPEILEAATTFLAILLVGMPFQSASMAAASSLQVQGKPKACLLANLVGTALNLVLDPLFIFVFHWGLTGAAIATSASQIFTLGLVLVLTQGRKSLLKLDPARLTPWGRILAECASIGLPLFLVHLVSTFTMVVANNAVRPYGGELALAVIGVVNTVSMVISYPLYGITNGAQPLFGYNYGAGHTARLKRLSALVGIWTFALAAAATAVSVAAPEALIRLFNDDPSLLAMGSRAIRIFMASFFLFPLGQLPATYFQSTGRPVQAGVLMLARSAAMIAGMLLLPRWFGLDGVCLAGPASDIVASAIGSVLLARMGTELNQKAIRTRPSTADLEASLEGGPAA